MKISLEVVHSCTIKRKKPWPKIFWLGRQKQQLFIADHQRLSHIDPATGKTKRKVTRLAPFIKQTVAFNTSNDGMNFCAVLTSGDLIVWTKDTDLIRTIPGRSEFSLKLGFSCPSVFICNDSKKIILVTSRNKIYVWESSEDHPVTKQTDSKSGIFSSCKDLVRLEGNWSSVVASKEVKTVEDSKELVLDVKFKGSLSEGLQAMCCFVFNYENQMIVNVLKIRWLNGIEVMWSGQSRFETLWISYEPSWEGLQAESRPGLSGGNVSLVTNKSNMLLNTRGAYVVRLSHSGDLIALACNQKYVERNSLVFMSPSSGAVCPVNLRSFGLGNDVRGRNYWIQEVNWMFNDLYLVGITKHGAIFLVSRLGDPLLIHAVGKETMGPALYLTLHPLIIFRGNNTSLNQTNNSMSSTAENQETLRQRYCVKEHPSLPIFACSDGYLMCVFKLDSDFSSQSRLIREIMNETIGLLNSVSKTVDRDNYRLNENYFLEKENSRKRIRKAARDVETSNEMPEWGLATGETVQSERDSGSDSGVDSNDMRDKGKSEKNLRIAQGKIIFSYLPQVVEISEEVMRTDTIANKMERAFEYLKATWGLLISTDTDTAIRNPNESDQTAHTIQQTFTHLAHLFLKLDPLTLQQFTVYKKAFTPTTTTLEEFKVILLVDQFTRMLKCLRFDPASNSNPNSHMIIYIGRFVEKFCQSLLKFENVFNNDSVFSANRSRLFSIVFNLLNHTEKLLKSVYSIRQDSRFILKVDSIFSQKLKETQLPLEITFFEQQDDKNKLQDIESDSSEKVPQPQGDTSGLNKSLSHAGPVLFCQVGDTEKLEFTDFILERCWNNLMHYAKKYRLKLETLGGVRKPRVLKELDCLIVLVERRMQKFPASFNMNAFSEIPLKQLHCTSFYKKRSTFKINKADLIYLDLGNIEAAIDNWLIQLNDLFTKITSLQTNKHQRITRSNKSFLLSNAVNKSIIIAHKILYACVENYKLKKLIQFINSYFPLQQSSPFSLLDNTFNHIQRGKPLPSTHLAIVATLKSLARFIAIYLTNHTIFIFSVTNPMPMPSLLEPTSRPNQLELSKAHLTNCINTALNRSELARVFSADKVLELLIVTGLHEEAVHFAQMINDWKSSFLISSILKETPLPLEEVQTRSERLLTSKVCDILGLDKNEPVHDNSYMKLMEKGELDSVGKLIKELLLCSVMTRSNTFEPLFHSMINSLVLYTCKLTSNSLLVHKDFYLPAPPIFCIQMQNTDIDQTTTEASIRIKLHMICKCIITLLVSANLHTPLIKWYLEQLVHSSQEMRHTYGIPNSFKIDYSLKTLLVSVRYQKLGYIPENVMLMFRDFCAVVVFLEARDKFSGAVREYSRYFIGQQVNGGESEKAVMNICEKIIEYGNALLGFSGFLGISGFEQVRDIVLSVIGQLTRVKQPEDLGLEKKLAICVSMKSLSTENKDLDTSVFGSSEEIIFSETTFNTKLTKLLDSWSRIKCSHSTDLDISMADLYQQTYLPNQLATFTQIGSVYGNSECFLSRIYELEEVHGNLNRPGGYYFERTNWSGEFFELFFKLGFDKTEQWEQLIQSVNKTPLLPEFFEEVRDQELGSSGFLDKQHIMLPLKKPEETSENKRVDGSPTGAPRRRRSILSDLNSVNQETTNNICEEGEIIADRQIGLFRSYSIRSSDKTNEVKRLLGIDDKLLQKKTVSFGDENVEDGDEEEVEEALYIIEQPLKVIDFGHAYVETSKLAIWLIGWAGRFQKLLMGHKTFACQWYNEATVKSTTLRLTTVNANFLVCCVYLANGNNLEDSARKKVSVKEVSPEPEESISLDQKPVVDDDLTQISNSISLTAKQRQQASSKLDSLCESSESLSTTLDISSFTDNHQIRGYSSLSRNNGGKHRVQSNSIVSVSRLADNHLKSENLPQGTIEFETMATSRTDVTITSARDASDYYNLKDLSVNRSIIDGGGGGSRSASANRDCSQSQFEQKNALLGTIKDTDKLKKEVLENSRLSEKRKSSSSLEFLANLFGSNKKDPSPQNSRRSSKSPTKPVLKTSQVSTNPILKLFRSKSQESNQQNSNSPTKVKEFQPSMPVTNNVQEIVRSELKKIVQLQHDTVMSFLNNGQAPPSTLNNSNQNPINQQLRSIFQQQQASSNSSQPIEFVIETKVKTIDSNGRVAYSDMSELATVAGKSNYFMKEFEERRNEENYTPRSRTINSGNQKKSSFIKIPLLTSGSGHSELDNVRFPMIDNRSQQQVRSGLTLLDLDLRQKDTNQSRLNLEDVRENIKSARIKNIRDFTLLKLNYNSQPVQERSHPIGESPQPVQLPSQNLLLLSNTESVSPSRRPSINIIKSPPTPAEIESVTRPTSPHNQSQQTQCQKPLYDGYILAPDAFADHLNQNNTEAANTYAEFQYKSTQYLRSTTLATNASGKKTAGTSTDGLANSEPLAPNILFKLKFDSGRKDREEAVDEVCKDFVNVIDLDSHAVDDMLRLIETEQSKRSGKYVEAKKSKKLEFLVKEEDTGSCQEADLAIQNEFVKSQVKQDLINDKKEESRIVDGLTEKLLCGGDDDWREYDEVVRHDIEEASKKAGCSVSRQRMLNEFKYIDEKIRTMNEMASNMQTDYDRYRKVLINVRELSKEREAIERYQSRQSAEERIKNDVPEVQASVEIVKRNSLEVAVGKEKKKEIIKKPQPMARVEASLDVTVSGTSYPHLKQDTLDEFGGFDTQDLDSDKIDELLEKSSMIPTRDIAMTKVSNKVMEIKKAVTPTPMPYVKKKQATEATNVRRMSPSVNRERQMSAKRESLKEAFSQQREIEAQKLLADIVKENSLLHDQQRRLAEDEKFVKRVKSKSPKESKKGSVERRRLSLEVLDDMSDLIVPKLSLEMSFEVEKECAKMVVENKKPSLMTKTILELEKKKAIKQADTERLLRDLEQKARHVTDTPIAEKLTQPAKKTQPYTTLVRVQRPDKLRAQPQHKPLTYGQVLSMHQEKTNAPTNTTTTEICKIFGTRRVPGLYKGYVKSEPRKPKTYQQICRETKPVQSQAKIAKVPHNLTQKLQNTRTVKYIHSQQRRFKPYNTSLNLNNSTVNIEDVISDWSLDEDIKRILYEPQAPIKVGLRDSKKKKLRNVSSGKDIDQDTLADTDGDFLLEELLEDERKNELMYENAMRDLTNFNGGLAEEEEDYVNQVGLEDLKNFSLTSESAISSFIDWDQIDQLIGVN